MLLCLNRFTVYWYMHACAIFCISMLGSASLKFQCPRHEHMFFLIYDRKKKISHDSMMMDFTTWESPRVCGYICCIMLVPASQDAKPLTAEIAQLPDSSLQAQVFTQIQRLKSSNEIASLLEASFDRCFGCDVKVHSKLCIMHGHRNCWLYDSFCQPCLVQHSAWDFAHI